MKEKYLMKRGLKLSSLTERSFLHSMRMERIRCRSLPHSMKMEGSLKHRGQKERGQKERIRKERNWKERSFLHSANMKKIQEEVFLHSE